MNMKIDLKIFAFAFLFFLTKQIKIYVVLLLFAFIHEMAHCIAGRLMGFQPKSIDISPLGFRLRFQIKCEDYNIKIQRANLLSLKKMWIALAGPLINVLLGIIALLYQSISHKQTIFMLDTNMIVYANMLLFLFNMIPIYPLDGGRILKEIVYMKEGLQKSYMISQQISYISVIILTAGSSLLILFYHNVAIVMMVIYLWILVISNRKKTRMIKEIYRNLNESI